MAANQIDFLQLAANDLNLVIHEKITHDKRKKVQMFFATTKEGASVSPILNYDKLNHFLLGWHKAVKHIKL